MCLTNQHAFIFHPCVPFCHWILITGYGKGLSYMQDTNIMET